MKNDNQLRLLLLLRFLYEHSSEDFPVSAVDILNFWKSKGIHADRKSVYGDIAVLKEFGVDVIQRLWSPLTSSQGRKVLTCSASCQCSPVRIRSGN